MGSEGVPGAAFRAGRGRPEDVGAGEDVLGFYAPPTSVVGGQAVGAGRAGAWP